MDCCQQGAAYDSSDSHTGNGISIVDKVMVKHINYISYYSVVDSLKQSVLKLMAEFARQKKGYRIKIQ